MYMKKKTAVLLVVAGMMLNACNPLETAKPIETTAAVSVAESTTAADSALVSLETSATDVAVADASVDKALAGKKKGETNPLRPTLEADKLKPKKELKPKKDTEKESDDNSSYSEDPVITEGGYQSYLDVMAVPLSDPPEGLCFYQGSTFWFDNQEWDLEIWTSATPSSDGWYGWDDQNRFYIKTYNEAGDQFVLMDDMVALGYPSVDVYDDGKWLHIVVSDFRTATAKITDYSYLSEDNFFAKTVILEQYGVNYMTGIEVR